MTNPPGAMPPLPEPVKCQPSEYCAAHHTKLCTTDQMHAYAAPLIARVAELQRQNEAQKDEWLSWEAKRAALEKDAARYRWLRDTGDATWRPFGLREGYSAQQADATIDAAIASAKEAL